MSCWVRLGLSNMTKHDRVGGNVPSNFSKSVCIKFLLCNILPGLVCIWNDVQKHFWKEHLCVLQVFLCSLVSRAHSLDGTLVGERKRPFWVWRNYAMAPKGLLIMLTEQWAGTNSYWEPKQLIIKELSDIIMFPMTWALAWGLSSHTLQGKRQCSCRLCIEQSGSLIIHSFIHSFWIFI